MEGCSDEKRRDTTENKILGIFPRNPYFISLCYDSVYSWGGYENKMESRSKFCKSKTDRYKRRGRNHRSSLE